jgi:hypothetical protein
VLSWDSDELTRVHNLHVREFANKEVCMCALARV